MNNKHISKFLSLVLRHQPQTLGITLNPEGWTPVAELLKKMQQKGMQVDLPKLQEVVATNDKQRFAFSADGSMIRASQGHSVAVELGLDPMAPPLVLYHGTASRFLEAILQEGLKPGSRQHVHLSADTDTALKVGSRHGSPVILLVNSGEMHKQGHQFYQSANGVWLTQSVAPAYLKIAEK